MKPFSSEQSFSSELFVQKYIETNWFRRLLAAGELWKHADTKKPQVQIIVSAQLFESIMAQTEELMMIVWTLKTVKATPSAKFLPIYLDTQVSEGERSDTASNKILDYVRDVTVEQLRADLALVPADELFKHVPRLQEARGLALIKSKQDAEKRIIEILGEIKDAIVTAATIRCGDGDESIKFVRAYNKVKHGSAFLAFNSKTDIWIPTKHVGNDRYQVAVPCSVENVEKLGIYLTDLACLCRDLMLFHLLAVDPDSAIAGFAASRWTECLSPKPQRTDVK